MTRYFTQLHFPDFDLTSLTLPYSSNAQRQPSYKYRWFDSVEFELPTFSTRSFYSTDWATEYVHIGVFSFGKAVLSGSLNDTSNYILAIEPYSDHPLM